MKKSIAILSLLLLSVIGLQSKSMYFDLSFSQFYREGDENLLEFYYSYPDTNFVFKYTDNGNYEGILSVELKITILIF